jgi:hypothetical protein
MGAAVGWLKIQPEPEKTLRQGGAGRPTPNCTQLLQKMTGVTHDEKHERNGSSRFAIGGYYFGLFLV